MKLTTRQLKSIIREEVRKTVKNRKRLNEMTELEDYISRAVQDIKAGTHPVTGEPTTGTVYDLEAIADDLAEGFGDGEHDPNEIFDMLVDRLRT